MVMRALPAPAGWWQDEYSAFGGCGSHHSTQLQKWGQGCAQQVSLSNPQAPCYDHFLLLLNGETQAERQRSELGEWWPSMELRFGEDI